MDAFATLETTIAERMSGDAGASYVASLAAKGRAKIAQKVGAPVARDDAQVAQELPSLGI